MKYVFVLLIAVAIIWLTFHVLHTMYKHEEEEFLPVNVRDLSYDPETKILRFIGGRSGKMYVYRGSCTVWHSMDGHRLDVMMESKLSDIYNYWKYQNKEK